METFTRAREIRFRTITRERMINLIFNRRSLISEIPKTFFFDCCVKSSSSNVLKSNCNLFLTNVGAHTSRPIPVSLHRRGYYYTLQFIILRGDFIFVINSNLVCIILHLARAMHHIRCSHGYRIPLWRKQIQTQAESI